MYTHDVTAEGQSKNVRSALKVAEVGIKSSGRS